MREKEVRDLYKAYSQVYQPQEEDKLGEGYQRNPEKDPDHVPSGERPTRRQRMNDPRTGINSPAFQDFYAKQMGGGKKKKVEEEVEQFDEEAPKRITKDAENPRLMKDAGPARLHNPKKVDEETDPFDIIRSYLLEGGYAETPESAFAIMANMSEEWRQDIMEISQKTATKAYATSSTGEFEGADSPRDVERTDRLRGHIKRKFGKKAAEHADRAAHSMTFGRKGAGGMPPKP